MGKRRERALMVALTDVLEAFSAAHSDNCDYEEQDDDDEECMWCRGASHAQDTLNRVRRELDRQQVAAMPATPVLRATVETQPGNMAVRYRGETEHHTQEDE